MDDGKEDSHPIWRRETAMEKELAAADERALEAERRAWQLEQQLAEKQRKLEEEKAQILKNTSFNDIRDEAIEEQYPYKEGI